MPIPYVQSALIHVLISTITHLVLAVAWMVDPLPEPPPSRVHMPFLYTDEKAPATHILPNHMPQDKMMVRRG